ncbi:MAG: hypothetical protein BEN19_00035 [Epulopiscium sp. Nuni2H_MBin003]|nr:MAG: hypothetical protein BEN19_00035 [Epulopiscium sp. Nuni2H_MBin003]
MGRVSVRDRASRQEPRRQESRRQGNFSFIITIFVISCIAYLLFLNKDITVEPEHVSIPTMQPNVIQSSIVKEPLFNEMGVLTNRGEDEFITFMTSFYEDYKVALLNQNYTMVEEYIDTGCTEQFNADFKSWFIDNKNIVNISVSTTIGEIYYNIDDSIDINILETIELTHEEVGNRTKYQLNLLWSTTIADINDSFKISNRELTESLVAYDRDGEWVKY